MTHTTPIPATETGTQTAAATATACSSLTPIQLRFCHEYIRDFKPHRAAERAGYSPSFARAKVYNLLKNPAIAHCINLLVYKMREELHIAPSEIVRQMLAIAFAKPSDFVEIVEETQTVKGKTITTQALKIKSLDAIPDEAKCAIAELRQTKTGIVIKMHNKLTALTALGKHLGCFHEFKKQSELLDEQILYIHQPGEDEIDLPPPPVVHEQEIDYTNTTHQNDELITAAGIQHGKQYQNSRQNPDTHLPVFQDISNPSVSILSKKSETGINETMSSENENQQPEKTNNDPDHRTPLQNSPLPFSDMAPYIIVTKPKREPHQQFS